MTTRTPPFESPELRWLEAYRSGDSEAAEKLWDRYSSRVKRLAGSWLGRVRPKTFDEYDVAISTFDELFSAIEQGRYGDISGPDALWSLIARIAIRKAKDRLRGERALKRQGGPQMMTVSLDDTGLDLDVPDDTVAPELVAIMTDEVRHLLTAFEDEEIERLVMLKLDGHTNDEIAQSLGYSRSSIQRMLRTVRTAWEGVLT